MIKKNAIRKPADGLLPADIEGFDSLSELALDLRSSWNHCTDDVWRQLDPVQWKLTHNTRGMTAFRCAHPVLSREQFYSDAEIQWFGPRGRVPRWTDPKEKCLTSLIHEDEQHALCLMFNAGADAIDFDLPPAPPGARWHLAADTSRETPQDLHAAGDEPLLEEPLSYHLGSRSSAILLAQRASRRAR